MRRRPARGASARPAPPTGAACESGPGDAGPQCSVEAPTAGLYRRVVLQRCEDCEKIVAVALELGGPEALHRGELTHAGGLHGCELAQGRIVEDEERGYL